MASDTALLTAVVGSPTALALAVWLFKKSIVRNLEAIDNNIKKAIDDAAKALQGVNDVSMRIAIQGERFDNMNKELGRLQGITEKLTERINGVAAHYKEKAKESEEK